jgi:hypothetical protein
MTLYVDQLVADVAYDAYEAYDQDTREAHRLLEVAERDDPRARRHGVPVVVRPR